MMEDHEFCDSCEGCRPAMFDARTGQRVPDDDPKMVIIHRVWNSGTTYAQRRAFIEVTLKNSCKPHDVQLSLEVVLMIQRALKELEH